MLWDLILLFAAIFYFCSPIGLSDCFGHLGAIIISLSSLKEISKYILFWILILITLLTAQESRFSLEYILFSITLFFIASNNNWTDQSEKATLKRKVILLWIFILLAAFNLMRIDFSERGSLLLWLPVYLILYYSNLNHSNIFIYIISGVVLYLSNKFTTLLAFIISLRSKIIYLFSIFLLILYFIFKQKLHRFILKSIEPRLYIWKSTWNGFLDKPLYGHGFGTFALDFPLYRTHAKVLGGRIDEQIAHGHSLITHYSFELGLIGIFLIFILLYLVYINKPRALLPLLVISLFDIPLVAFNQFLLGGLILVPFIKNKGSLDFLFYKAKNKYVKHLLFLVALILTLSIFIPSIIGHYYYSTNDLDTAIKWDNKNSLYYFTRGATNLNKNTVQSEQDLTQAIKLTPHVAFFHGFLGAAQLANNKYKEAKDSLEIAMRLDGGDGYWCLLYAYANYKNKKIFNEYKKKALNRSPEIKNLLSNPNITSAQYIGNSTNGDSRLSGFYRTGEDIYFPLPIIKE